MGASRLLETEHDRAQVGLAQPVGREPAQDAALLTVVGGLVERPALASDDDHQSCPPGLGMAQEAAQRLMRLGLVHPVQVERAALVLMKFAMAPMATHLTPEQSWVGLPEPWRAMYRLKALEILEAGERKP